MTIEEQREKTVNYSGNLFRIIKTIKYIADFI